MSSKGLTPEQNERVRKLVRDLLRQHDGNQTVLAPKLGLTQPTLSSFLSGRSGTSYGVIEHLAKLLHMDEREVLGKTPSTSSDQRALAAELCEKFGVKKEAIESVLAEPLTAETADKAALWWTDVMRWREREMIGAVPSPVRPIAEGASPESSGARLVSRAPGARPQPRAKRAK